MKILLTSDLNGRKSWYQWLASQQPELLVIAGNLLGDYGSDEQDIDFIIAHLSSLPFPVAVCGGPRDSAPLWFPRMAARGILIDGGSAEINDLLITCLPHGATLTNDVILRYAQKRRDGMAWLVVHHDPPSSVSGSDGSAEVETPGENLLRLVSKYQPDYLACGLWQDPRYHKAWYTSVGRSKCFSPCPRKIPSDAPSCVILDTETKVATWLDRGSLKGGPSRVEQTRFD